ncbi:lysoplasmalogenase family protein [Streptomyces zhihengii]
MSARATTPPRVGGPAGVPPLLGVFALLATVNVVAVGAGALPLEWATKPLLAPVLAAYLWRTTGTRHARVLAGLGFATAGDVTLLVPGTVAFAVGIGFFLGAQLCWTSAFVRAGAVAHLRAHRPLCALWLGVWAAANAVLAPLLGPPMAVAIGVYSLALVVMALTAHALGRRAAWGGAVFVVSDALIGAGAAGADFPGRPVLVMATYTAALALLTTAFARSRPRPPSAPTPALGDEAVGAAGA